jgi:autotransporter-associated beta strand protein
LQGKKNPTVRLLTTMKTPLLRKIAAACLLLTGGLASTQAQNSLYWDPGLSSSSSGGGSGTWNLNSTANWYNNTSDVKWTDSSANGLYAAVFGGTAGTVTLNTSLSASNLQFTTTGYTLSGSGTLTLGSGGIDASTLSSGTTTIAVPLQLPAGQELWQVGSGGTLAISGAVSRSTGAAIDYSSSGVTTSQANVNGIIGAWATVGGANSTGGDWAANDGSGNVVAYSGYTAVTGSQTGSGASAQNWKNSGGNVTLTASATINSLNQLNDFTINNGVTLTLNSGGLILGNVSRWMITGTSGALTSGSTSGELFVHVPDASSGGNWTIWPIIKDETGGTPVILVKDGAGLVKLGNQNTYSGGTFLNAGTLAATFGAEYGDGYDPVGLETSFGLGPVTVINGSQLQLGCNVASAANEYDITNAITLNNGTIYAVDAFDHVQGPLTIGAGGGTLGATYCGSTDPLNKGFDKGLFVDGTLTGTGNLTLQQTAINAGNNYDTSIIYFTSQAPAAQNTYSGTVTVVPYAAGGGSYLYLIGSNALANATINLTGDNTASSTRLGSSSLIFGSGTNLNGLGYATIGGLTGSGDFVLGNTLSALGTHSIGAGFTLSVGNNNSSTTYSGVMSGPGGLTKVGTGTLTLSGAETYTGNTTISAGTLALTGSLASTNINEAAGTTFDVSGTSFTLGSAETLHGAGTVKGAVSTASGAQIYMGGDGFYATNAFTGNVTLATSVGLFYDLGTSATGANDLMTVAGTLTANNNIIHIKAPSTSANLDTADYTLISSASSLSGSFSGISWDVMPANAAHYSLVVSGGTLKLHYTAVTSPTGAGQLSATNAVRNQTIAITVTATNGTGGSIISVTVDASQIGGSSSLALVNSGGNVWTGSVAVAPATAPGTYNLAATLLDTVPLSAVVNMSVKVSIGNDVWNGQAGNAYFDSNLNWTNKTAPGYVGDSLEFAGTANLSPDMDQNYSVSSITFDSGAGSFTIGSAESDTLTNTSGSIVNNSANTQTLNVNLVDTGSGLTKTGNGAVVLGGNDTLTGPLTLSGGALGITGTFAASDYTVVGGAANNTVLNISGSGSLTTPVMYIGNVAGAAGAVYQTGGTVDITTGTLGDLLDVGNITNSYGYYAALGGTLTVNGICVGGENNPAGMPWPPSPAGSGILEINGATVNNSGWIVMARGSTAETGILNLFSGSINHDSDNLQCNWGSGQTCIINILGGSLTSSGYGIVLGGSGTGILNLNGGLTEATTVTGGIGLVNFNGGILQAAANESAFISVADIYVYGGGAIIDPNGDSVTIAEALIPPTGKGVASIGTLSGGAGYIAPPIVTITNAAGDTTGVGATAIAQINRTTGTVTNIIITSPGVNYTAAPVFVFSGGGATTQASVSGVTLAANVGGGLTVTNSGTLTLSGANTYTGATVVTNSSTLALTGSLASTNIIVGYGATFDVSGISSYAVGANQSLSGWGTINGAASTTAGSKIYGGTDGTYGTNTFNSTLTLVSGAACFLDLGTAYNGDNDEIVVSGTLTASGNVIHLKAPSTSSSLDTTADYVLISAGSISGTFSTAPVWDVAPANAAHYSIVTGSSTVTLHYSATAAAPTVTSASATPTSLLANQATRITAVVTPGSASIATVTADLSALGGSTLTLVQSNSTSVYTNTAIVPAAASPGTFSVTVTATDSASQSGSATISVTIGTTTDVWNGSGADKNWSTALNWVGGLAPGLAGDGIEFAGTAGLTPSMDNSYSITGLTFDSGSGGFTISASSGSTLTITGGGSIVNNSAQTQTLNVPVADSGAGIVKGGSGAVVLSSSANTYTGPTTVNLGALTVAGSIASTANVVVGNSAGNSVLNLSSASSVSPYYLLVGNVSGAVGAVYQAGSVTASSSSGYDNLSVGNMPGAYGYYSVSGSLTVNGIAVAGEDNNGVSSAFGLSGSGIMDINPGASVTDSGWLVMARNNNSTSGSEIGVLNVFGGTLTYAGGGIVGPWDAGETAIINIMGGSVSSTSVGVYLGNSTNTGILNLNGGVLEATAVEGYNGQTYAGITGGGTLNFNGGTLQAAAASSSLIGVSSAYVYSGGATIDNNGNAVTISQPLLAPTGKGVKVLSYSAGAGYIAPPIVTVTNATGDTTGTGATAIAQINPATGLVTNVVVTCPGVNYTATPLFVVSGGGATTPATITGTLVANTSGGLTAVGSGTTTLSGADTYTGNTTVSAGTLELASPVLSSSSTVTIASGALLQLDFTTTNVVSALVLNGVSQATGVYNSTTASTYISGSGSLRVGIPIASNPTNITASVTGTTLTITWPTDHIGWILQSQTNSLSTGLTTNGWVDVPNSSSAATSTFPIVPANPTVYYRLRHP